MIDEPPGDIPPSPTAAPGSPPTLSYEAITATSDKPRLRDLCWTFTEGAAINSAIIDIWGALRDRWHDFAATLMVFFICGLFQSVALFVTMRIRLGRRRPLNITQRRLLLGFVAGFLNNAAVLGTILLVDVVFANRRVDIPAVPTVVAIIVVFSSISGLLLAQGLKRSDKEQLKHLR
jgi:hypothetical protein